MPRTTFTPGTLYAAVLEAAFAFVESRIAPLDLYAPTESHAGLLFGYGAGRVTASDGTKTATAAGTIALGASQADCFIEVDDAGVVAVNYVGWSNDKKAISWAETDAGGITAWEDMRDGFSFGSGGSGTVTAVTASGGLSSTGGSTPQISITDDGVTDAKIGNRTADPAQVPAGLVGTVTQWVSWIANRFVAVTGKANWFDDPEATLQDAADHIADTDPHSGVLPRSGARAMTGALNMGGQKITNGAEGTNPNDFVIKSQLDIATQGFIGKGEAKACSTTNVNISNPGTSTFDTVTLGVGDILLLTGQTTGSQNWLYTFNGPASPLTRAVNANTDAEVVNQAAVFVPNGTNNKGVWYIVTADPIALDATGLVVQRWNDGTNTGETSTGANVGTEGIGVYDAKSGSEHQFRNIVSTSTALSAALNAVNKTIELTVNAGNIALTSLSGVLTSAKGGTGFSTYAQGDLLWASAVNTLSKLAGNLTSIPMNLRCVNGVLSWAPAPNYNATSSTSVTVPASITGTKAFNIGSPNFSFVVGQDVKAWRTSDPTIWITGRVQSYVGNTLNLSVTGFAGAGVYTDWSLGLGGAPGDTGPAGPTGTGDVDGPASAVDGQLAVFDGITGKIIRALSTLGVGRGGTNADLSATGGAGHVLKQATTGAPITVGALVESEIPTLSQSKVTNLATDLAAKQDASTAATLTGAQTLSNKRITERVTSEASNATPTPDADTTDIHIITAQAVAAAFAAPTGAPTQGQKLIIRIKDNGTARALSFNAIYRAIGVTLPTTTVLGKTLYLGFIYNSTDTKWDCIAVAQEA